MSRTCQGLSRIIFKALKFKIQVLSRTCSGKVVLLYLQDVLFLVLRMFSILALVLAVLYFSYESVYGQQEMNRFAT